MNNSTATPPLLSALAGIIWPSIPEAPAATMLAMQYQLEQSQWLHQDQLLEQQFIQLHVLIRHARRSVPFYEQRLNIPEITAAARLTPELWRKIPLLSRDELQRTMVSLQSSQAPKGHGNITSIQTSGSIGMPVTVFKTQLSQFFWQAFTLREHLWHQRDFTVKLAAIRPEGSLPPQGLERPGWGPATDGLFATGPSAALSVRTPVDEQAAWLRRQNPAYLLSLPSNIAALARHFLDHNWKLPGLLEVRTYGELLDNRVRDLCRQAWEVAVTDMYSAQEVGYVALQCPEAMNYHVQAENVLLEIVDEKGIPCPPGEIGQVVLTPLHNFAMPLIRYAIGDYAALGPPCSCGRGLPVLQKIAGRSRNMLVLPDGRRHWPSFPAEIWSPFAGIRQFQLIQNQTDRITVRLVADRHLSNEEEQRLTAVLRERFGYPFHLDFEYPEGIERSKGGKFEDFISKIGG